LYDETLIHENTSHNMKIENDFKTLNKCWIWDWNTTWLNLPKCTEL